MAPEEEGIARYCLTSTVMLSLTTDHESSGTFSLSGSIRRQVICHLNCYGVMFFETSWRMEFSCRLFSLRINNSCVQ